MKRQLYLVTETFPYGIGEKTFILPELSELIKNYDVTIISHASKAVYEDKEHATKLDEQVKVVNIDIDLKWYKKVFYLMKFFADPDGRCDLKYILKEKKDIFSRTYQSIGFYALAMENFKLMKRNNLLCADQDAIYYTYWYFYYTYSLTKYRKLFPRMKVITRTHGFDLYADRYKGRRQPFKEIIDVGLDKIFFISQQGKEYYLRNYGFPDKDKYVVSRLGTIGTEFKGTLQNEDKKIFRIVSCSDLIPLKRIDLLIRALSLLDEDIEWIHFGDGYERTSIFELAEKLLYGKENVCYEFKGFVPNGEIVEFYQTNYVNCFINVSSSEGIPVSIQEAMSFGIPIIATDVGGTSELFDNNGILLENNPSAEVVANAIRNIMHEDKAMYQRWRDNSQRFWRERYNARDNSIRFVEMIGSL